MRTRVAVLSLLVGAALSTTLHAADVALEQLFRHTPADAGLALVVPNLDKAVGGVRDYVRALDMPSLVDDLDELQADKLLAEMFDAPGAYDPSGPLVLAVDIQSGEAVVTLRLKDADLWRAETGAAEGESGLLEFVNQGQTFYGRLLEPMVVVGTAPELVKAATGGGNPGAAKAAAAARQLTIAPQAVLVFDAEKQRAQVTQGLAFAQMMMRMGMMQSQQQIPPATMAMLDFFVGEFNALVNDIEVVALGVAIDGKAATLENICIPAADSDTAKYLKTYNPSERPLLAGLSGEPAGMVMAYDWRPPAGHASMFERMIAKMKEAVADDPNALRGIEAYEPFKQVHGATAAVSMTETGMVAWGSYLTPQAAQTLSAMDKIYDEEAFAAYMNAFGGGMSAVDFSKSQTKIGGVDALLMDIKMESPDPAGAEVIKAMYGEVMHFGIAAQGDALQYAFGPEAKVQELLARQLKGGPPTAADNPGVKACLEQLPERPQLVVLADVGHWLQMGLRAMKAFGVQMKDEFKPAPAPLAGCATYLRPEGMRNMLVLPSAALKPALKFGELMSNIEPMPTPGPAAPPPGY